MNSSSKKVLQYLTGYDDIDAVTVEELQKLVEENPYFPVTRVLLAKRLKAENNGDFLNEAQKTALYYSNVHWLQYQLTNDERSETVVATDYSSSTNTSLVKEDDNKNTNEVADAEHPITAKFSQNELDAASDLAHETLQEPSHPDTTDPSEHPITTEFSSDELEAASILAHETLHLPNEEQTNDSIPAKEVLENNNTVIIKKEDELLSQQEEEAAQISRDIDEKTEASLSQLEPVEITPLRDNFEQAVLDSLTPSVKHEIAETSEEMAGATSEMNETTEAFLQNAQALKEERIATVHTSQPTQLNQKNRQVEVQGVAQTHETAEPDEHEKMFQNIKAMLDASSEEADADVENAVIPIDPYYTIDYFASQGIKLELEQNPQDQLGKNLKKFTQWLKHMKKLGPEDATEVIIKKETEADIVKIADSSNTAREVVTEAMASVLEKQGKKDKAIELYTKLSFLNPGKSAYFAHKIKNLNGI